MVFSTVTKLDYLTTKKEQVEKKENHVLKYLESLNVKIIQCCFANMQMEPLPLVIIFKEAVIQFYWITEGELCMYHPKMDGSKNKLFMVER